MPNFNPGYEAAVSQEYRQQVEHENYVRQVEAALNSPNPPAVPPPLCTYEQIVAALNASHIGRRDRGGIETLKKRLEDEGSGRIKNIQVPWKQLNRSLGNGLGHGKISILVGAGGVAKSWLALNILIHAGKQGLRWRLLPLEDSADQWVQRALAVVTEQWWVVENPKGDSAEERGNLADRKRRLVEENAPLVDYLFANIHQNPWLPVEDSSGVMQVHPVYYQDVLSYLEEQQEHCDLVCIDPLSQIHFSDDGRDYRGEAEFMRRLTGIAARGTHILLVAHTTKGTAPGANPLDCIQGSAMLGRLAHIAMLLRRDDPARESNLMIGAAESVQHRLTLSILKSRQGYSGNKVAMDLSPEGPSFIEYGLIEPPLKKG